MKKNQKDFDGFDIENSLWKSDFGSFFDKVAKLGKVSDDNYNHEGWLIL